MPRGNNWNRPGLVSKKQEGRQWSFYVPEESPARQRRNFSNNRSSGTRNPAYGVPDLGETGDGSSAQYKTPGQQGSSAGQSSFSGQSGNLPQVGRTGQSSSRGSSGSSGQSWGYSSKQGDSWSQWGSTGRQSRSQSGFKPTTSGDLRSGHPGQYPGTGFSTTSHSFPRQKFPVYTPEQTTRYQSLWLRYQKAQQLKPEQVDEFTYRFSAPRSSLGYWEVHLNAVPEIILLQLPPDFTNMCSPVIDLIAETNAEITWEQTGGQPVILSDVSGPFISFDRRGRTGPFHFRACTNTDPVVCDDVTVHTTPTSVLDGISQAGLTGPAPCLAVPCRFVPTAPSPESLSGSQRLGPLITWDLPTCELDALVAMVVQQNLTGVYTDLQVYTHSQPRVFAPQYGRHYRIQTVFERGGQVDRAVSCPFYVTPTTYGPTLAIDEHLPSGSSGNQQVDLARITFERLGVVDTLDSIGSGAAVVSVTPLTREVQTATDSIDALSTGSDYVRVVRNNQVVIG